MESIEGKPVIYTGQVFHTIEKDGEPIAYARVVHLGEVGYLQFIGTKESERGQGHSTELLKKLKGLYARLFLVISKRSEVLKQMYINNGFKVVDEVGDILVFSS